MGRKSIFSGLAKSGKQTKRRSERAGEFNDDWYLLKSKSGNRVFDLSIFNHSHADKDNPIIDLRVEIVKKIARQVQNKIKDTRSVENFITMGFTLRQYICFCDSSEIEPFSKEGYFAYADDDGELRRKIKVNESLPEFIFELDDGFELGVTEVTASTMIYHIRLTLKMVGIFNDKWSDLHEPFVTKERELTIPYSSHDTETSLEIIYVVFDATFKYIENFHSKSPNALLPREVNLNLGDKYGTLLISNADNKKIDNVLNYCMWTGHALFSYFTALNRGVMLKAAHPIEFNKRSHQDKTMQTVSLSLWKSRSGKFVAADLTDEAPIHDVNDNEFDIAIEKKSGVDVVTKLVRLAEMYGSVKKGSPLFFLINNKNVKCNEVTNWSLNAYHLLSRRLDIRTYDTTPCNKIFMDAFNLVVTTGSIYEVSKYTNPITRITTVSKKIIVKNNVLGRELDNIKQYNVLSRYIIRNALALLISYNKVYDLFHAKLPFDYRVDEEFIYSISKLDDGSIHEIKVTLEYEKFLKDLVSWSRNREDINPNGYLVPHSYRVNNKKQKEPVPYFDSEFRLPNLFYLIRSLGINSSQFYLNLNSRRFRALTATMAYNDEDGGYEGAVLLDNEIETFDRHYSNGDPEENQLIMSQSLEIVSHLFKGVDKEEAMQLVLDKLKIETLAFDELKSRKLHINQNGTACNGRQDIDKSLSKDDHRSAAKRAKELKIGDGDIICYQFDQCCFCKNCKMVDDVDQVYKLLSYIEILEERADLRPDYANQLLVMAEYFKLLINENISDNVINGAHEKLILNGIHPLMKNMGSLDSNI